MPREYEFIHDWTYRTPMVTVTYPKGWKGALPAERQVAARKARALVSPEPKPRTSRAPKKADE